jgi:hypothetical protein
MIVGYNIDTDVIVGKLTEDEIDRTLYERKEDIIDYFIDKELISYKKQIVIKKLFIKQKISITN